MNHADALRTKAVERYLLSELDESETEDFELHFFSCEECTEDLRIAALFRDTARAVFEEGYVPKPRTVRWFSSLANLFRQPAFAAPAFAAVMLASVVGYQNLKVIPGLKQIQAATPVLLTAERSEKAPVRSYGESLLLKVDAVPAESVRYELRTAQGKIAGIGGTAAVREHSLMLAVPAAVVGPGDWDLVVYAGSQTLHYPFSLSPSKIDSSNPQPADGAK